MTPVMVATLLAAAGDEFAAGLAARDDAAAARPHFASAARLYDDAWADGERTAGVARNRGRAHALAGDTPRAIGAFHAGLAVAPWDRGLRDDLAAVRASVPYPDGLRPGPPDRGPRPGSPRPTSSDCRPVRRCWSSSASFSDSRPAGLDGAADRPGRARCVCRHRTRRSDRTRTHSGPRGGRRGPGRGGSPDRQRTRVPGPPGRTAGGRGRGPAGRPSGRVGSGRTRRTCGRLGAGIRRAHRGSFDTADGRGKVRDPECVGGRGGSTGN